MSSSRPSSASFEDSQLSHKTTATRLATAATTDVSAKATSTSATSDAWADIHLISTFYKAVPSTDFTVNDADRLGRGGYAEVYGASVCPDAQVLEADTAYAFKKFRPLTLAGSAVHRLHREVAIARSLASCPSIHPTIGGVVERDCNGILMHRAEESLTDVALAFARLEKEGRLTEPQRRDHYVSAARLLLNVVAALQHMHDRKMIHCDVKPDNILIQGSDTKAATLSDFGSVQLVKDVKQPQEVKVLSVTPFYTAPETISIPRGLEKKFAKAWKTQELRLRPKVSRATDVWSLGVTLLVMLNSGVNPLVRHFKSDESFMLQLLPAIAHATDANTGTATNTRSLDNAAFTVSLESWCPSALVVLVQRCLILDVTHRYSLSQVRQSLETFVREATSPSAPPLEPRRYTVHISPSRREASAVESEPLAFAQLQLLLQQQLNEMRSLLEQQARSLGIEDGDNEGVVRADNEEAGEEEVVYRRRLLEEVVPGRGVQRLLEGSQRLPEKHNGHQLYQGPRGGRFYVNERGEPRYLPRSPAITTKPHEVPSTKPVLAGTPTGTVHHSNGSANGSEVFMGPRGGQFYLNSAGNKTYVQNTASSSASGSSAPGRFSGTPTGTVYQSAGSANGREVFAGPRGGHYYINANGNRSYIK